MQREIKVPQTHGRDYSGVNKFVALFTVGIILLMIITYLIVELIK